MNDNIQTAALSLPRSEDLPERLQVYDDIDIGDRSTDIATGLASAAFIWAALRRSVLLWCGIALACSLAGLGVFVARPAGAQASTSILLPPGSYQGAITDDAALAQSRAVAGLALRRLRLRQSVATFARNYTVTALTDRVLVITVKATSVRDSVREANAVAAAFLAFQAKLLKSQQQLLSAGLQQELTLAKQHVSSIGQRISQLLAQPTSSTVQTELASLRSERGRAKTRLAYLTQNAYSLEATDQTTTTSQLKRSMVLDPAAPIKQSLKRRLLLYVGGGLIAGLALGMGLVLVRALASDKLRRRDDVASVMGASVRISVGRIRPSRLRPSRRGLTGAQSPEIRRIVAHVETALRPSSGGPASLAILAVDDVQVPAVTLASVAISCAQRGMQVVVADLYGGAPAARLLGASGVGVGVVHVEGTHLVVAIPEPDDVVPVGPIMRRSHHAPTNEPLARAAHSADLLLTLMTLDPSLGGEHLATWATAAIAMVTAGKSSATRVHAVGEMVRLAGVPLISAVLVGADKTDESLGAPDTPGEDHAGGNSRAPALQ